MNSYSSSRHPEEEAAAASSSPPEAEDEGSDADNGDDDRHQGHQGAHSEQTRHRTGRRVPRVQSAASEERRLVLSPT